MSRYRWKEIEGGKERAGGERSVRGLDVTLSYALTQPLCPVHSAPAQPGSDSILLLCASSLFASIHPPSAFLLFLPPSGTSIIQVTATDADDPTYGNSAKLVYTLVQGQQYFSVDPQTGEGPSVNVKDEQLSVCIS